MIFAVFFFFVIGLVFGSFFNALVYRLAHHLPFIFERSVCPHCSSVLSWHDLIPLASFFILKGRCRFCAQKISWRYPFVEGATALAFSAPWFFGHEHGLSFLILYYIAAFFLLLIFACDVWFMIIPDFVSIPAIISILIVQLIIASFSVKIFGGFIFAGGIAAGFFLVQYVVSRGRWIGGGDIRLGFLIGCLVGWPSVIVALFSSYVIGTVTMLPFLVTKTVSSKSKIPFGIFLTAGALIAFLWGEEIIAWYKNMFLL